MWHTDYDYTGPMLQRYNNIIKSDDDERSYRALLFRNEMRVLLISDPSTDKAAAALDISMGYMNDPEDLPGLSHLFQHMLYLTNKTDTPQKMFRNFVSENNGTADAMLLPENSVYFFDIAPSNFKNAFMNFIQLLLQESDFPEDIIKEEITLMDHEREVNRKKDKGLNGLYYMMRWSMCQYHPFSKIGIGHVKSSHGTSSNVQLLHKRLYHFYNICYIATNMTMCILSKDSLDNLEDIVVDAFSSLQKFRYHVNPLWQLPRFLPAYKIWCAPDEDCQKLYIIFPTNAPTEETTINSMNMSECFLAYLIEYEGRGTFATTLKAKNWIKSIEAGEFPCTSNLFAVAADMTEEGLEHIDDIMILFFQYINLLRKSKLRRQFNEYKEIAELKFRFKKKESPLKYVQSIVRSLYVYYPVTYVLRGNYVPQKWVPEIINDVTEHLLSPLNVAIYMISPKYKSITNKKEPWTGLRYKKEFISKETCAAWINSSDSTILNAPTYNEFIPTTIQVKPQENVEKFPTLVIDSEMVQIWHKHDDVFNKPRANMIFHFMCPLAYDNPVHTNYTIMFIQLLDKSLSEYVQPASLVNLRWKFYATIYGIELKISGFNDKQNLLLKKIIERMANLKLNPETFEMDRQNNIKLSMKKLRNFKNNLPYEHAQYYLSYLLTGYLWDKEEILKAATTVTFDKLQRFISDFFLLTRIVGLIHGNITQKETHNIYSLLKNNFIDTVKAFQIQEEPLHRDIKLKNGWHFVFEKENTAYKNSCIIIYYQVPADKRSVKWTVYVDLLFHILNSFLYNDKQLTNKKLGYISYNGIHRSNEMQGFTFTIQGRNLYSHEDIKNRFDLFMCSSMDKIDKMSKSKLHEYKVLFLKSRHAKKPETLDDVTNAYWAEILSKRYLFDRFDIEIKCLDSITVPMLHSFFKEIVNAPTLSVCVTSTSISKPQEIIYNPNQMTTKINNVKSYKESFKLQSKKLPEEKL